MSESGFARKSRYWPSMLLLLLFGLVCFPLQTHAASFVFSGSDAGGTGSATVDVRIVGHRLTWTMENTSPGTLDSGSGGNAPGITGFGFDLNSPKPTLINWTLTAFTDAAQSATEVIGGNGSTNDWVLETFDSGVTRDFLPNTNNGSKGAIYNPDGPNAFAGTPRYFSTATLEMRFHSAPSLSMLSSLFVRMQNVGRNGNGSLKLFGTPTGPAPPSNTSPAPEPASAILFGIGLAGCAGVIGRRRKKKRSS